MVNGSASKGGEFLDRLHYGDNRRIFRIVAVQDLRHKSNHFMAMVCLCGASPREHSRYLGKSMCLPLRLPGRQTRTQAENKFSDLRPTVLKQDKCAACHKSWILEET